MERLNVNEICSLCLEKPKKLLTASTTGVISLLFECASIILPPHSLVCTNCNKEVLKWYIFKKKVVRALKIVKDVHENNSIYIEQTVQNYIKELDNFTATHLGVLSDDNEVPDQIKINIPQEIQEECDSYNVQPKTFCSDEIKQESNSYQVLEQADANSYNNNSFVIEDTVKIEIQTPMEELDHVEIIYCPDDIKQESETNNDKMSEQVNINPRQDIVKTETEEKLEHIHEFPTDNAIPTRISEEENNKYQCDLCPKSFISKAGLTWHRKMHLALNRGVAKITNGFSCPWCPSIYEYKQSIQEHIRFKHTDMMKKAKFLIVCDKCRISYVSQDEFYKHLETCSQKLFQCGTCKTGFFALDVLRNHIKLHPRNLFKNKSRRNK